MKPVTQYTYIHNAILLMAFAAVFFFTSCTTPKDITYFQDRKPGESEPVVIPNSKPFKLQPGDRVSISVKSRNEELSRQFNISNSNASMGGQNYRGGYLIDDDGNIEFPVLGEFHIAGLDRQELTDTLTHILRTTNLVNDAIVSVEYTGLYVTVLGEGGGKRVNIEKDKLTFFELLGQIGDLSINAKRRNVLVTREENGIRSQYEIDLTLAKNVYESPAYYVHQNDIIYLEPNSRVKRQTAFGDFYQMAGFWTGITGLIMSVFSFINIFK